MQSGQVDVWLFLFSLLNVNLWVANSDLVTAQSFYLVPYEYPGHRSSCIHRAKSTGRVSQGEGLRSRTSGCLHLALILLPIYQPTYLLSCPNATH